MSKILTSIGNHPRIAYGRGTRESYPPTNKTINLTRTSYTDILEGTHFRSPLLLRNTLAFNLNSPVPLNLSHKFAKHSQDYLTVYSTPRQNGAILRVNVAMYRGGMVGGSHRPLLSTVCVSSNPKRS